MDTPNTTHPPKLGPKALLWALLVCQVGATIFFLGKAWAIEREAGALDAREPEMRLSAIGTRDRIRTEKDIAELRTYALKCCDGTLEEWRDIGYRLHQGSSALRLASLFTVVTSVVLAYLVYALREKKAVS